MIEVLTTIFAFFLIGCGFLILVKYGLLWIQCQHIRLQKPYYAALQNAEMPQDIATLFQSLNQELAPLGFRACKDLQVIPLEQNDFLHPWERLYRHQESATYAKANLRAVLEPHHCFDLEFYSYFADGAWLITVNGKAHGYLTPLPQTTLNDPYCAHYADQWESHQQQLQALAAVCPIQPLDPESCLQHLTQWGEDYLEEMSAKGLIKSHRDNYRLSLAGSGQALEQYVRSERKLKAIATQRKQWVIQRKIAPIQIPSSLEITAFQAIERMQAQFSRGWKMPWVIWGSLGLFLISFAHQFAFDWQLLFNFTIALVLHEVGHLVAMRCCGYQNTSMLFLPFLGAVATAQKEDASLLQKSLVLLAGPLPGLLLGMGLFITFPNTPWISNLAWILVGLNGFNLLPIYPLDGGQLAHLLMFAGHRYGDLLFRLCAVVGLSGLAIQTPMLWLLVLVVGRSIPNGFRIAKLTAGLQSNWQRRQSVERHERLRSIFAEMRSQGLSQLPLTQRYILAKALLEKQQDITASWKQRFTLTVIYLLTLVGGGWGMLQAMAPLGIDSRATASEDPVSLERHYSQQLIAQQSSQIEPYLRRADLYLSLHQPERAIVECTQAIQLAPDTVAAYQLRSKARDALGDRAGALADKQTVRELSQILGFNPFSSETPDRRLN